MLEKSQDYKVFIDENEIEVRNVRVSAYPINQIYKGYQRPIEQTEIAGLASFDFSKKVYVTVRTAKRIEIPTDCIYYGKGIVLEIKKNMWTTSKEYGTIKGVHFKNITAPGEMKISIVGASEKHMILGIVFENMHADGGKHSYHLKNVENIRIE